MADEKNISSNLTDATLNKVVGGNGAEDEAAYSNIKKYATYHDRNDWKLICFVKEITDHHVIFVSGVYTIIKGGEKIKLFKTDRSLSKWDFANNFDIDNEDHKFRYPWDWILY